MDEGRTAGEGPKEDLAGLPPERAEVAAGPAAPTVEPGPPRRRGPGRRNLLIAAIFLLPGLLILGAIVVYPTFFSAYRSLFDRAGDSFVGLGNYQDIFTSRRTFTAIRNNLIWVAVVPAAVTALGLVFAVMIERIRWGTAFKVAVFMPMAISFLATGIIWRLVYETDPDRGIANAGIRAAQGVFRSGGTYAGAKPSLPEELRDQGGALVTVDTFRPGETVALALTAIPQDLIPEEAVQAEEAEPVEGGIAGVVWRDFRPGGGEKGVVEDEEVGLIDVEVEAVTADGEVAASGVSRGNGVFLIPDLDDGEYTVRLAARNFQAPFAGVQWLGPTLITPALMFAYIWIWAGFAMVVIGAGLAAIPREVLEAARVDGAGEWQLFRRVTVPLLAPVLGVVVVTLAIQVLKVFDLVLVLAPGSVQANANVIALEMFRNAFQGATGNRGIASALAVLLFILVIPVMILNIKRFRSEST